MASIATVSISTSEFKTLVSDILEELATSDTSPLKMATEVFRDYLEDSGADMDADQKASALADFLKDGFTQVNSQAISASLDILKTNANLELSTYTTEVDYNLKDAQRLQAESSTRVSEKDVLLKNLEYEAAKSNNQLLVGKKLELLAKLKKQYGYGNVAITSSDTIITVDGVNTTVPAYTGSLNTSTNDGALDEQIEGYQKVNYKDLIKTTNEHIALITNAGGIPPAWMLNTVKLLTEMVTDGDINYEGESLTMVMDKNGVAIGDEAYIDTWQDGALIREDDGTLLATTSGWTTSAPITKTLYSGSVSNVGLSVQDTVVVL